MLYVLPLAWLPAISTLSQSLAVWLPASTMDAPVTPATPPTGNQVIAALSGSAGGGVNNFELAAAPFSLPTLEKLGAIDPYQPVQFQGVGAQTAANPTLTSSVGGDLPNAATTTPPPYYTAVVDLSGYAQFAPETLALMKPDASLDALFALQSPVDSGLFPSVTKLADFLTANANANAGAFYAP